MELTSITEYRGRRIHTSQLLSGTWVASIVARGGTVEHVPGEFKLHEQALQAAKESVSRKAGPVPS